MKDTDIAKIRQLLKRKIVAARNSASKTDDYLIPLDCRYIVSMSIQELEQILAHLPCPDCQEKPPNINPAETIAEYPESQPEISIDK